jgi:signal transduction histidine kinase
MTAVAIVAAHRPVRGVPAPWLVVATAYGVATIVVIRFTAPWSTTYSGASAAGAAADLAGGLGLLVAGLAVRLEWPAAGGLLAMLAGATWLARDWIGWQEGPAVVRSTAMIAAPLLAPLVLATVVTFPENRFASRSVRLVVLVALATVGMVTVGWALTNDPRTDVHCWNNCTDNSFLVWAGTAVASALARAGLGLELGLGLGVVFVCAYRIAVATSPARRLLLPVMVPGALIGGCLAAHAVELLRHPLEGPEFGAPAALFQATGWSLATLACGLVWTTARVRRVRSAVAQLVADLGAAPPTGSLATALGAATGDPGLDVAYWIPERAEFVDASGAPAQIMTPGPGQALTQIVRNREVVAIVRHDATAVSAQRLERAIGPGARLAIDNERLRANLLAQLADLRRSQARIVAVGDAERRRLERNLHDGAQRDLLALSYDLRLARSAAAAYPHLERFVAAATDKAREALVELRELAHGIYPAVLTEGGVGPALRTLADTAPIPIHIDAPCTDRFGEQAERAVYVVVAHAVEDAARTGVEDLSVRVARSGDRLLVTVEGPDLAASTYLSDRLGAIGGTLIAEGGLLRAELPCA